MEEIAEYKMFIHSVNIYTYFMPRTGLGIEDAGMTKFHVAPGLLELSAQWERYILNNHISDYSCVMTDCYKENPRVL